MHRMLPVLILAILSWAIPSLGTLEMVQWPGPRSETYHTWYQVHAEFPIESNDILETMHTSWK